MMLRLIAFCLMFSLSGAAVLHAQNCYQKALLTGDELYYKGEHEKAREAWEKGKNCPGANITKLDERIRRMDENDLDGVPNELDKCPIEFGAKETNGCACSEIHRWLGIDNYYDNNPDSALVHFKLAKNCSDVKALQDIEEWETKIATQKYAYDTADEASNRIYKVVYQKPEFTGGEEEMMRFIYNNVDYPPVARETGIEGTIFIQFIIEKDGHPSHIKVIRDAGAGLGDEAARVVKMMPPWQPGTHQDGKPLRVYFNLPVKFKLE